ncbi:K(+)/H(+) antiporter [Gryganskiella cystojenkinii]|nr:K(+)/H(+) antiporter [Gryganskiella cystojenkinii]
MAGSVVTGLNPTTVNPSDPFPLFVIQTIIIIGLCYILHMFLRRLKQPRVISEVIAGILLGPSVMGRIPGFATTIFNPASLTYLNLVSNIGLVFFLFLVGLELDPAQVVKRARFALGITLAGMVLPLGVGAAVSYVLYEELGPTTTVGFGQFLLFCGVAMSITAFPVLARILAEQKLLTTKVGFLTICAGAVGDIVAWILLALVVSIINSASRITPLYVVLLSIAWTLILVFIARPMFIFMIRVTKSQDEPSQTMMAFTMAVVLISAFVTDIIGVHAIFGAFLVGLIIPNDTGFADGVTKRIEDLVSVIFLPVYFALSGLKTQVGLLDNGRIWGLVILTTFVACFGKIVGCTGAAKVQGMEWRESFAIGILMNCKGLIELIVLNIGYDAKVINDKVFVIMVAMCLITTCMTSPMVAWIYPPHYQRAAALRALAKEKAKNGDVEGGLEALQSLEKRNTGVMLCLDKIHNLPALMTILEMLHRAVPKSVDDSGNNSTLTVHGAGAGSAHGMAFAPLSIAAAPSASGPKLLALRLLHLTERSSSVLLAATERAEVLRRDTLMVVFQAFAKLNSIQIEPRMTLSTDPDDFAQSIYDEAVESGTGTIIFPWNSTSLPDLHSSSNNHNFDESLLGPNHPATLAKPHVTSNTQVLSRLLQTTAKSDLTTAVFVDRELGGSGQFLNIMVTLYGSSDDEESLKLASTLSHNQHCKVVIVRIRHPAGSKLELDEKGDVRVEVDAQSIDSEDEDEAKPQLPEENSVLIQEYFSHRVFADRRSNKRASSNSNSNYTENGVSLGVEAGDNIFVQEVPSIQDAIGLAKGVLGSRDLLVLGRGFTKKAKGRRHSYAASTHTTDHHAQPIATSTGYHLHTPSAAGTPTHPIDNPLGDSSNHQGLRSRNSLRTQPSSRDVLHSTMTVSNILGLVAQSYLNSDLGSCLLVVQSGKGGHSPAATQLDISRITSSVRTGRQHSKDLSLGTTGSGGGRTGVVTGVNPGSQLPVSAHGEQQQQQHIRIVESDEKQG